jgi:hypothetical protein
MTRGTDLVEAPVSLSELSLSWNGQGAVIMAMATPPDHSSSVNRLEASPRPQFRADGRQFPER